MATIYRCDRCRAETDRTNSTIITLQIGPNFEAESKYDLCSACLKELREWVGYNVISRR